MASRLLRAGIAALVGSVLLLSIVPANLAIAVDDPPSVRQPYIEVGDCWSYRASRLFHHGWINEYRECVTYVDRGKNVVLALATVKDDQREIETSYSPEWAESAPLDGRQYEPPARYLRFPLHVGDKYTVDFTLVDAHDTGNRIDISYEMRVIGWDEVSVPAGKFRALRIEGVGHALGRYSQADRQTRTIWYAPGVNRPIKWSFVDSGGRGNRPGDSFEVELTKYELNN